MSYYKRYLNAAEVSQEGIFDRFSSKKKKDISELFTLVKQVKTLPASRKITNGYGNVLGHHVTEAEITRHLLGRTKRLAAFPIEQIGMYIANRVMKFAKLAVKDPDTDNSIYEDASSDIYLFIKRFFDKDNKARFISNYTIEISYDRREGVTISFDQEDTDHESKVDTVTNLADFKAIIDLTEVVLTKIKKATEVVSKKLWETLDFVSKNDLEDELDQIIDIRGLADEINIFYHNLETEYAQVLQYLLDSSDEGAVSTEASIMHEIVSFGLNNPITKLLKKIKGGSVSGKGTEIKEFSIGATDGKIAIIKDYNKTQHDASAIDINMTDYCYWLNYKGNQIKTGEELFRAVEDYYRAFFKMRDTRLKALEKELAALKTDDIPQIEKIIEKHMPDNFFKHLVVSNPSTTLKIKGCHDTVKLGNMFIRTVGIDLATSRYTVNNTFAKNKNMLPGVAKVAREIITRAIDAYYTFYLQVFHWLQESVSKGEKISKEDFTYSLEADEPETEENAEEKGKEETEEGNQDETPSDTEDDNDSDENEKEDEESQTPSEDETETEEEDTENTESGESGESDPETSEEDDEEERPRPEVILDDPEQLKEEVSNYLAALAGYKLKELTLFTAKEVNRPLYHMSMNPSIKFFSPQVSSRTLSKEDRAIPRISTSTSLIGCMNGYQSIFSDISNRKKKNFTGLYTIYELPYQLAIKPSKALLPDVAKSDEYWIVSWKKETYSTTPNVIGEFSIPQVSTTYGNDGEDQTVSVFLKVRQDEFYLTHDIKVPKGFYEITLKSYTFSYPLENNKKIKVKEITENEYNKFTSLSVMIKQKG